MLWKQHLTETSLTKFEESLMQLDDIIEECLEHEFLQHFKSRLKQVEIKYTIELDI